MWTVAGAFYCCCCCFYTAAKRKELIFVLMSSNVVIPKKCMDLQNLSFQRSKCGLWVGQAGLCADFSGLSTCSEKYIRSSYIHGQSVVLLNLTWWKVVVSLASRSVQPQLIPRWRRDSKEMGCLIGDLLVLFHRATS